MAAILNFNYNFTEMYSLGSNQEYVSSMVRHLVGTKPLSKPMMI